MQSTLPVQLVGAHETEALHTLPAQTALAMAASAFVALCAHLSVPLWFTPVPLSLVNFAVILTGLALGPVAGFSAMVLYLAEGASGLPAFSPHGLGGVAQLLGPTGGYLLSYPLVAATAGFVSRRSGARPGTFLAAACGSVAATAVLFLFGAGWLAYSYHLGASEALRLGVAPFLPGEVAKVAAASGIATTLGRWYRA